MAFWWPQSIAGITGDGAPRARGKCRALVRTSAVLLLSAAAANAYADVPTPDPPVADLSRIGRLMFFDPSLSASGKLACATCHDPRYAYGPPPGKAIMLGGKDMKQPGTRAIPSIRYLNRMPAFAEKHKFIDGDIGPVGGLMWDGRAASLQ